LNDSHCQSPDNRRIEHRHGKNVIIWQTEPWLFRRALFLSTAQGGCEWCGNIPNTVCHPQDSDTYGTPAYLDFRKAGCYPLCMPCSRAEHRGQVLCPRCRRQGHYCAPGDVCWSCKPEEEREKIVFKKEQRTRSRNEFNRKMYRQSHPRKVIDKKTGTWVTYGRSDSK
jgi:hypothetical protein